MINRYICAIRIIYYQKFDFNVLVRINLLVAHLSDFICIYYKCWIWY